MTVACDLGNLTTKSDVGFYSYAGPRPHAVTQTGDSARGYTDYEYDPNGSMIRMSDNATAAALRTITWSSFNKPVRVQDIARGQTTDFIYGPGRSRVRQTVNQGTLFTRTIAYVGGVFERSSIAGTADKMVHYIPTGGGVVIYNKFDDGIAETDTTRYLHKDHLGSIDLITDEAGLVAERRSYDAWGRQRNPDMTEATVEPAMTETRRGFTGHEHLDSVGLIHMNGRVYDPVLGRFLSADPYVTDPTNSQSFNRYSYVTNNPLSFTDPSGFHIGDANGNPKTTNSYDPPDNTGSHAPEGTNGGGDGGAGSTGSAGGTGGPASGGTGGGISPGAKEAKKFLQNPRYLNVENRMGLRPLTDEDLIDLVIGAAKAIVNEFEEIIHTPYRLNTKYNGFKPGDLPGTDTPGPYLEYDNDVQVKGAIIAGIVGILRGKKPGKIKNLTIRNPAPALRGDPWHPDSVAVRVKPPYKTNGAHVPGSRGYNPRKSKEPADAAEVYDSATRSGMDTWWGRSKNGDVYRFFSDNNGTVHFSGSWPPNNVPNYAPNQYRSN